MKYNEVARKIMQEEDIAVDDAYDFSMRHLTDKQRPQNVHYTPAGYEELARYCARTILKQLPVAN